MKLKLADLVFVAAKTVCRCTLSGHPELWDGRCICHHVFDNFTTEEGAAIVEEVDRVFDAMTVPAATECN